MSARSCTARGASRSFIAQSDGTRPRPRHRLRTGGVWLALDLPARREGGQDRPLRAPLPCLSGSAWRARFDPGRQEASAARLPELFPVAWSCTEDTIEALRMEGHSMRVERHLLRPAPSGLRGLCI